jgi:hypothetical protein
MEYGSRAKPRPAAPLRRAGGFGCGVGYGHRPESGGASPAGCARSAPAPTRHHSAQGSGPEVTRDWVCPLGRPDGEADFSARRLARGRRDEEKRMTPEARELGRRWRFYRTLPVASRSPTSSVASAGMIARPSSPSCGRRGSPGLRLRGSPRRRLLPARSLVNFRDQEWWSDSLIVRTAGGDPALRAASRRLVGPGLRSVNHPDEVC